jgi:superfamily I DNA/RNA helicase
MAAVWTSVGVVVPPDQRDAVAAELTRAEVDYGTGARGGLARTVTLLDPAEAKGLEFDAVVVVEPGAIHTDQRGGRLLYIALTRAVQALAIVHARPLPAALAA